MASLQRKNPTIKPKVLPQDPNKPVEIVSNLPPKEFANLSGLKETSFDFQEISESELNLRLSKNAQTFRLGHFDEFFQKGLFTRVFKMQLFLPS